MLVTSGAEVVSIAVLSGGSYDYGVDGGTIFGSTT